MKPSKVEIIANQDETDKKNNKFWVAVVGLMIFTAIFAYITGSITLAEKNPVDVLPTDTPSPTLAISQTITESLSIGATNNYNIKILILNGSGSRGLAAKYRKLLTDLNFIKISTGNMGIPSEGKMMFFKKASENEAVYITEKLGESDILMVPLETKSSFDVVLLVK